MTWSDFFSPDVDVLALPTWRYPRVLLSTDGGGLERWRASALYPGFSHLGKVWRLLERSRATLSLAATRVPAGGSSEGRPGARTRPGPAGTCPRPRFDLSWLGGGPR